MALIACPECKKNISDTASACPQCLVYAVKILDIKIGGSHITVEKRVSALENDNIELKQVTNALLKSLYVILDGSKRFGGCSEEHCSLILNYIEPISKIIEPGIPDSVKKRIAQIISKGK